MYFTYIMEIIPSTECDLIPMYCEKKAVKIPDSKDINITYILTTKTLVHSKNGKPGVL